MSTVCYDGPENIIDGVERDGYFVIKNFFKRSAVEKARAELKEILDRDEDRRRDMDVPAVDRAGPYRSIYVELMHTIWFPSLQSPRYLELVNDLLDSDVMRNFMKALSGDNARMRIDLIRRSTGVNDFVADFQIPHVWHRDTLGEFTFGIFFDDLPDQGAGGTAIIPGTHWDARDPRWDLMLGESKNFSRKHNYTNKTLAHIPDRYLKDAPLNKRVTKKANANKVEMLGQMGDIYFFINDCWHGRAPNLTGKRWMISRFGGFGTEFPFKDDIPLPPDIDKLHGPLAECYNRNPVPNTVPDTLLRRIAYKRKPNVLTKLAAAEKDRILARFYSEPSVAAAREAVLAAQATEI